MTKEDKWTELYNMCLGEDYSKCSDDRRDTCNHVIISIMDNYLSESDKLMMSMYYMQGHTMSYISKNLDIDKSEVQNRIRSARHLMETCEMSKLMKEHISLTDIKEFRRYREKTFRLYSEIRNNREVMKIIEKEEPYKEHLYSIRPCDQVFRISIDQLEMKYTLIKQGRSPLDFWRIVDIKQLMSCVEEYRLSDIPWTEYGIPESIAEGILKQKSYERQGEFLKVAHPKYTFVSDLLTTTRKELLECEKIGESSVEQVIGFIKDTFGVVIE